MKNKLFLIGLYCLIFTIKAYSATPVLHYTHFLKQVVATHPTIKSAKLYVQASNAAVLEARGAFDPFFSYESEKKQLNNQLYYNYQQTQLQIPIWNGIDVRAGMENAQGLNTNPENTLGASSYVGIKIPIGADLLLDKRNLQVQQNQQQIAISKAEQQQVINELLADAQMAYVNWSRAYYQYQLFAKLSQQNKERVAFVITEYHQGLRPAIDTSEAVSQWQQVQLNETDAYFQFKAATQLLENYVWNETTTQNLALQDQIPDSSFFDTTPFTTTNDSLLLQQHPKVLQYEGKLKQLQLEKTYKTQQLLPKAYLKANALSKGYFDQVGLNSLPYQENYKLGFTLAVPLLQRSARGALLQNKFKREATTFEKAIVQNQLFTKVQYYQTQLENIRQQLLNTTALLKNFRKLYEAEQLRFQQGESSVFLINSRELKIIEALQKQLDLYYKWKQSTIQLALCNGTINT